MNLLKRFISLPKFSIALVLLGTLTCIQFAVAADKSKPKAEEPDYTKGANPEGECDTPWALGSTGAFGNIWKGDQRMIQILNVADGSPAAGKLLPLDVIIGVASPEVKSEPRFTWEARLALSAAITEAEKSSGKLVLNVWRPETNSVDAPGKGKKGQAAKKLVLKQPLSAKVIQVTLALPVKGSFSATSPWNCEKTEALINDAAQAIMKGGLKGGIPDDLNALGLLATGDKKFLPIVRDYVLPLAKDSEQLDIMGEKGISAWHGGYRNILLAEYYLLTKDEAVLPGLTALSHYLAYGQSGVGTWSHGMADVKLHGLYGPSAVYGAINQCSIICAISLALAQKCGVTTDTINDAVDRSRMFYGYYVDKGTIPYGEHAPAEKHDNNGKNSMAAVFFNIVGDKEATRYYTRMTLASYTIRENGHTGHYFAWQWGALGAHCGGPAAAQSFVKNTRWFTELERRADGSSFYQYQLGTDTRKTANWETTGQRLMQHCMPRKVLYITGKISTLEPITEAEIKDSVDAATYNPDGRSVKELLSALGNWSLVVRAKAAIELGKRDEDLIEPLIAMLDSSNPYARYGACTALQHCGRRSEKVVAALISRMESDKDKTMRYYAADALFHKTSKDIINGLGDAAKAATPALLRVAAKHDPEQDPMRMLSGQIAEMLFYSGRVADYRGFYRDDKEAEKIDRELLIPAMKAWLANPNGAVRSTASVMFKRLSEKELGPLWADIYYATKYQAAAGNMFGNQGRINGALILAQNRFAEGIPLGLDYLYQEGWGQFQLVPGALGALSNYGSAMKPYTEEILAKKPAVTSRFKEDWEKFLKSLDKVVELRSLKPFLDSSGIKEPVKVFPPKR